MDAAGSATEAMNKLALVPGGVDAVILDIGLPDRSGEALCREIRAIHPSLPIVLATGHGASRSARSFQRRNCDRFCAEALCGSGSAAAHCGRWAFVRRRKASIEPPRNEEVWARALFERTPPHDCSIGAELGMRSDGPYGPLSDRRIQVATIGSVPHHSAMKSAIVPVMRLTDAMLTRSSNP